MRPIVHQTELDRLPMDIESTFAAFSVKRSSIDLLWSCGMPTAELKKLDRIH